VGGRSIAYAIGFGLGAALFAYIVLRVANRGRKSGPWVQYASPLAFGMAVFVVYFLFAAEPERPRRLEQLSASELPGVFKMNYFADCVAGHGMSEWMRVRCRCSADKIASAHKPEELRKIMAIPGYHRLPQFQPFLEQCTPKQ